MKYIFSLSDPESTQFQIEMIHDTSYTTEQFKEICEEVIKIAIQREYDQEGYCFVKSPNDKFLIEEFEKRGFKQPTDERVYYDFEPFWNKEQIGDSLKQKMNEIERLSEDYLDKE
jgi:hypothetical protein